MLRDLVDNTKQRLSDSFGNLKSSIVKRINRIKGGVTSAEVPGTVLGPEVTPEYLPTERTLEQIYGIVTKPENVIRELSSINTKPSLPNEARRRIISEATLPESVPVETRPASTVTEFAEWTPKETLNVLNRSCASILKYTYKTWISQRSLAYRLPVIQYRGSLTNVAPRLISFLFFFKLYN